MIRTVIDILLAVIVPIPVYYLGWHLGRAYQLDVCEKVPCTLCEQRSRFAYYTFKAHNFLNKVPFGLGRYGIGIMVGLWYQKILKEGKAYDGSRSAKT